MLESFLSPPASNCTCCQWRFQIVWTSCSEEKIVTDCWLVWVSLGCVFMLRSGGVKVTRVAPKPWHVCNHELVNNIAVSIVITYISNSYTSVFVNVCIS